MRGRPPKKLTPVLEDMLLSFIAANGENYKKYINWCDVNQVDPERRFTERGYAWWIQSHRRNMWDRKRELQEEARDQSVMTLENRLLAAESALSMLISRMEDVNRKAHLYLKEEDEDLVQKGANLVGSTMSKTAGEIRSLLQHIATERGEWNRDKNKTSDPVLNRVSAFLDNLATKIDTENDDEQIEFTEEDL